MGRLTEPLKDGDLGYSGWEDSPGSEAFRGLRGGREACSVIKQQHFITPPNLALHTLLILTPYLLISPVTLPCSCSA